MRALRSIWLADSVAEPSPHPWNLEPETWNLVPLFSPLSRSSAKGDHDKALEFYGKALAIYEKVFGFEHPHTATSYGNIAYSYHALGNYSEALDACKKAVDIFEKVSGSEDKRTIGSKDWLRRIEQEIAELGLQKEGE